MVELRETERKIESSRNSKWFLDVKATIDIIFCGQRKGMESTGLEVDDKKPLQIFNLRFYFLFGSLAPFNNRDSWTENKAYVSILMILLN